MRERRRSLPNLGALALAIAFLLLQLGGAWHMARQDHVRCADHGEWVDVASRAKSDASPSTPSNRGPALEGTDPASGAHDHCAHFLASRTRGIVWQDGDQVRLPEPRIATAWTPDAAVIESGFALYLLAPKQSPPC